MITKSTILILPSLENKNKISSTVKAAEKHSITAALSYATDILDPANTPLDQNEPKYCYCNSYSYGDMIKCDNPYVSYFVFMMIQISFDI